MIDGIAITHEKTSPLDHNRLISRETMRGQPDIYMGEILALTSNKVIKRIHFEFDETEGHNLYGISVIFDDQRGIRFTGYHGGEFIATMFVL